MKKIIVMFLIIIMSFGSCLANNVPTENVTTTKNAEEWTAKDTMGVVLTGVILSWAVAMANHSNVSNIGRGGQY